MTVYLNLQFLGGQRLVIWYRLTNKSPQLYWKSTVDWDNRKFTPLIHFEPQLFAQAYSPKRFAQVLRKYRYNWLKDRSVRSQKEIECIV